jgi:hypothetical protein
MYQLTSRQLATILLGIKQSGWVKYHASPIANIVTINNTANFYGDAAFIIDYMCLYKDEMDTLDISDTISKCNDMLHTWPLREWEALCVGALIILLQDPDFHVDKEPEYVDDI